MKRMEERGTDHMTFDDLLAVYESEVKEGKFWGVEYDLGIVNGMQGLEWAGGAGRDWPGLEGGAAASSGEAWVGMAGGAVDQRPCTTEGGVLCPLLAVAHAHTVVFAGQGMAQAGSPPFEATFDYVYYTAQNLSMSAAPYPLVLMMGAWQFLVFVSDGSIVSIASKRSHESETTAQQYGMFQR